ncbi:uncharacterized protein BDCG_16798 [Blastomyces dermatitidis ER-3]|uniref:Uncharacterized protein n=1 Tax=Ajellomyces dermatitidis (strain ER-3 / ATCC MYA-2586) TaxID=559297 RepID=A0ABX2VUV0_AJEDR|nr:uncharacterized protein BDCG_16798 [Blastomyces dermatitidis ER-3]OAT00935.1 hypothetical protein BDCG_16798 [Blastomyces dermatitidis ER-3]
MSILTPSPTAYPVWWWSYPAKCEPDIVRNSCVGLSPILPYHTTTPGQIAIQIMMNSIQSHPHTCSQSCVLFTESVAVDDDDSSYSHSLDEAGSLDENIEHSDVYCSDEAKSDQQMKHLKMILEMNKKKQRVLELELQLEKLCQQRFSSFTDQTQNVNNHSIITSTACTATWNSNLSERLEFNLYKSDSCVDKTISQFKKDVKNTVSDHISSNESEIYQMTNLVEVINVSACFMKSHKDPFNRCLYISKDIIFQKNLYFADSLMLTTSHNLKVLLNAACKAAAVIPSATLGLLTAAFESDDSLTSTRDITIVRESTVRKSSVKNSLEDLLTDPEITALLILKNLTRAKAFMK